MAFVEAGKGDTVVLPNEVEMTSVFRNMRGGLLLEQFCDLGQLTSAEEEVAGRELARQMEASMVQHGKPPLEYDYAPIRKAILSMRINKSKSLYE